MPLATDYYAILGLSPRSSLAEIKERHRQLSKVMHPDRNSGDVWATDEMQRLNAVRDFFRDLARKAEYDALFSEVEAQDTPEVRATTADTGPASAQKGSSAEEKPATSSEKQTVPEDDWSSFFNDETKAKDKSKEDNWREPSSNSNWYDTRFHPAYDVPLNPNPTHARSSRAFNGFAVFCIAAALFLGVLVIVISAASETSRLNVAASRTDISTAKKANALPSYHLPVPVVWYPPGKDKSDYVQPAQSTTDQNKIDSASTQDPFGGDTPASSAIPNGQQEAPASLPGQRITTLAGGGSPPDVSRYQHPYR